MSGRTKTKKGTHESTLRAANDTTNVPSKALVEAGHSTGGEKNEVILPERRDNWTRNSCKRTPFAIHHENAIFQDLSVFNLTGEINQEVDNAPPGGHCGKLTMGKE